MKVSDFLRAKNEIILSETGLVLIPEDQIKDFDPMPLYGDSDADICPYCTMFIEDTMGNRSCEGCPMSEAGNRCMNTIGSTYEKVRTYLMNYGCAISDVSGIGTLVAKYNEENGFAGIGEE